MPMIRKVTLKNFKRFEDVTFDLTGHVVLAGPNNTGKTTLLQAIAAWALAHGKWCELNDFNPRRSGYAWQDLERLAFSAVSVRSFDLLWHNRQRSAPLEIGIQVDGAPMLTMEFRFRAAGQMQARPTVGSGSELSGTRCIGCKRPSCRPWRVWRVKRCAWPTQKRSTTCWPKAGQARCCATCWSGPTATRRRGGS